MAIALPHVVVRSCGPGIGPDLAAALSVLPLEVSEARDLPEARRVRQDYPPVLAVVVASQAVARWLAETATEFPGVPILLVSDAPTAADAGGDADVLGVVSGTLPLQDICWHVMESLSRVTGRPGIGERRLGPIVVEVDRTGVIGPERAVDRGWLIDGGFPQAGDSVASLVDTRDRASFIRAIERAASGDTQFLTVRLLDRRGTTHIAQAGLLGRGSGRVSLLLQPLIFGGPICGRRINNRDPITGLLNRWATFNALLEREEDAGAKDGSVLLLKLVGFAAISDLIGPRETDVALFRVASAVTRLFPWPAICGRLMGDTFLVGVCGESVSRIESQAQRLIEAVNGIELAGFASEERLRASVGIARVTDANYDLALRLAEAAMGEARALGGDQAIVAGSAKFTRVQARELTSVMDLGNWEVWLQPVARAADGQVEFHEALARFDSRHRRLVSRADFFTAGQAHGLLERFDRMLLLRVLAILASHPGRRLSANLTYESFVSESFPDPFLEVVRESGVEPERLVVEIAPRCLMLSTDMVRTRLERLADAGIGVAIDDFGSGLGRLTDLMEYPLAYVKLDEIVSVYVDDDPLQREFVRTVVSLCRARGITTVAEHTLTAEQMAKLVEDGIDLFQGEVFGMPMPVEQAFPFAPAAVVAGEGRG
jgi:diguanylate cyclase (GGDEF)-like protein